MGVERICYTASLMFNRNYSQPQQLWLERAMHKNSNLTVQSVPNRHATPQPRDLQTSIFYGRKLFQLEAQAKLRRHEVCGCSGTVYVHADCATMGTSVPTMGTKPHTRINFYLPNKIWNLSPSDHTDMHNRMSTAFWNQLHLAHLPLLNTLNCPLLNTLN